MWHNKERTLWCANNQINMQNLENVKSFGSISKRLDLIKYSTLHLYTDIIWLIVYNTTVETYSSNRVILQEYDALPIRYVKRTSFQTAACETLRQHNTHSEISAIHPLSVHVSLMWLLEKSEWLCNTLYVMTLRSPTI